MDSQAKIAADIRAWLEWQQYCGTDVWKVDRIAAWDVRVNNTAPKHIPNIRPPKTSTPTQEPSTSTQKRLAPTQEPSTPIQKVAPKKLEPPKNTKPSVVPSAKRNVDVPSWWQSIYENRQKSESFDFSRIPTGGDGLQRAFAFRDKNCDTKMCKWGVGRFDAEVVVIEGHQKHLDASGFKMLSDMREHVLRLSKNNLYWIPLKRDMGCGHCDSLAMGQLNAIKPKALLVFGFGPLELLNIRDQQTAESGLEFQVELNSSSVPAVCTHHPMSLIEDPRNKLSAQKALIVFRGILNRLRIR